MSPRRILAVAMAASLFGVPVLGSAAPNGGADPGERAEALLLGAAINRFVAKQLPVALQLPGDPDSGPGARRLDVVEARYCGAIDSARGRLVGVVRASGASAPPLLVGARDCMDKLAEVIRRAGPTTAADGPLAVIEIVAAWAPSQLRVSIGEVACAGQGEGARALQAALARAKERGPLAAFDTAGLSLTTARGTSLGLDLAFSFLKAGDGVLSTLTVSGHDGAPLPRPPFVSASGAPAGTDGIAGATLAFANRVVALYNQDGPLVLDVEGHAVEIRGLQLSGGDGALTVRGRATSRDVPEAVRVGIESAGSDLKVADARADPELEDCGTGSFIANAGCKARNAARGAAASALAAAINGRYRGQALRALMAPPPFSFDMGARRMTLRLTPLRASASGGALIVYGKADLD